MDRVIESSNQGNDLAVAQLRKFGSMLRVIGGTKGVGDATLELSKKISPERVSAVYVAGWR